MIIIESNNIDDFVRQDFEKLEIFIDDEGNLYGVRKGDLDTYWLRKENKKNILKRISEKRKQKENKNENEFLEDIGGPFLEI